METCDDEFAAAAKDFIKRQNDADKPFFVWLNFTHMHLYTHTKPSKAWVRPAAGSRPITTP